MLEQPPNKGIMLPAYLLTSLALRSDGVLYLTRQMKEIDLEVDSKRSEQGDQNQSVQKLIPDMFISIKFIAHATSLDLFC
jgi:hypothetical protein